MVFQNKFCESIRKGSVYLTFSRRRNPAIKTWGKFFFIFYLLTIFNLTFAQEPIALTYDVLTRNVTYFPATDFLFKAGDNISWAQPDYDDSDWITADTRFLADGPQVNWNGTGWFRIEINVDSSLVDRPIGIYLYNTGQLKLYLNGNLLFDRSTMERFPNHISFKRPGKNLIAVRFSNPDWEFLKESDSWSGFRIAFADYDKAVSRSIEDNRFTLIEELIFLIPALLLAFLHLAIFLFDRRTKQNLYYVFFLLSFALYIFIIYYSYYAPYQTTMVFLNRFGPLLLNFILLFGAFTIFAIFEYKHKLSKLFLLLAVILGVMGYITAGNRIVYYFSYAFISIVSSQAGSVLFRQQKKLGKDARIIQTGFMLFSLSGIYQMLLSLGIVGPLFGSYNIFLFGVLIFLFSMSLALAKEFVRTRKNLEEQLVQVRELSQKTLQQELTAKELETEKRILEMENKRKSHELGEARKLQLSMLPASIPEFPNLDISVYLTTATEVGGDYYDFITKDDGTLIIALGDATGHGAKAGLMVAIMKGLFKSLASIKTIPEFFTLSTQIIKDMKLGNLFMSLTLLRIKDHTVTASAAGMPPILIYKKGTDSIETFTFKGMPIGAYKEFPYFQETFQVESGDVLFVLSDGLPELFNEQKEMYNFNRVDEKLLEFGKLEPEEIINGFVKSINEWLGDKLPDDDITLMVIKFR